MVTARCVSQETLRRNEELNRKVLQQYEEFEGTIRNCYELLGKPEVYEQHRADRIKQQQRAQKRERWASILAAIVIWALLMYFS